MALLAAGTMAGFILQSRVVHLAHDFVVLNVFAVFFSLAFGRKSSTVGDSISVWHGLCVMCVLGSSNRLADGLR